MPTKYELQTELRELNRGFPRVPISKLKYHELEAMIDSIKKTRGETLTALKTKPPTKPGQYPPREIPSESIEDEDIILHVPQAPAERILSKPKKVTVVAATPSIPAKTKARVIKEDDEEPESLASPKPPVRKPKAEKAEPQSKAEKAEKVVKVADEAPSKSGRKLVHFCNCPDCKQH